ncbi:hypothetical protein EDB81DRAFT_8693 [Dactylonectria macrodidyma]|uniref:Uncharacterized protein n=1 Tax=Dactylonectria macrodidyma TaxID=307937 RepID=A0A9P9FTX5_9HYPO|nr:hypothetical protein EDB81DRAFT_8693 [Dactylonectria macrodidyma]
MLHMLSVCKVCTYFVLPIPLPSRPATTFDQQTAMQRCSLTTPQCPPSDEPMCLQFLDLQRHPSPGPNRPTFGKSVRDMIPLSSHTGALVDRGGTRPATLRLAASPRPPWLDTHQAHSRCGPGSGRGCGHHPRTREANGVPQAKDDVWNSLRSCRQGLSASTEARGGGKRRTEIDQEVLQGVLGPWWLSDTFERQDRVDFQNCQVETLSLSLTNCRSSSDPPTRGNKIARNSD